MDDPVYSGGDYQPVPAATAAISIDILDDGAICGRVKHGEQICEFGFDSDTAYQMALVIIRRYAAKRN